MARTGNGQRAWRHRSDSADPAASDQPDERGNPRLTAGENWVPASEPLHASELLGPIMFAPITALLFWNHASPTRLMLVITAHMVITAGFFVALVVLGPRMSWRAYLQVEDTWPLFTGALVGALPWILDADTARGHLLLTLAITVVLTSDTLFLAVRPSRVWPYLASFEGTSFSVYLLYRHSWTLGVFVLLFMFHLIGGYRSVQEILDKLRSQQDASDVLAHTDHLTRLQNRRGLARYLNTSAEWPASPVHLAVIDIDNFKQLNDRYGQAGGDAILQAVANELTDALGESWFLSRTGGDEFIAVSMDGRASSFARKITRFSLANGSEPGASSLRLSAGIARGMPTDDLLSDASAALRIAKTLGKNRTVEVTDELRSQIRAERALGARLEEAIDSEAITVWAQPIVDLRTGEPVSYEMLARWEQADGHVIQPRDFIRLAEDQGLTDRLGESIVRQSVRSLADLPCGISVSANVSPSHFENPTFIPFLRQVLDESQVAPELLTIEVIETAFNRDDSTWLEVADEIREMGIRLAIDDFGAGYSSLERLISLPADQLKLDICMMELTTTQAGRHLLGGIADFSRAGLMTVVVEGVETEQERRRLIDIGFTFGQGYLFARPAPLAACRRGSGVAGIPARSIPERRSTADIDLTPSKTVDSSPKRP